MSFYSFSAEHNADGSVAYSFTTKTTTEYRVYFYPACDYSDYVQTYPILFAFGFICGITKVQPNENKIENFDLKIKATVKLIFLDFIQEFGNEVVLLYHCDYHDGKQGKRNNLFKLWYLEIKETHELFMEDTDIKAVEEDGTPIITNYLGFFILNDNPNKEQILTEFHAVKTDLISEK